MTSTGPPSIPYKKLAPRMGARAPCALALVALIGCRGGVPSSARVFVSNEKDGTISVIDATQRRVTATLTVGKRPRGLRVSRDGAWLYVALSGSPIAGPGVDTSSLPPADRTADGIGVVSLRTLELVRIIESGNDPESFDLVGDATLVVSNEDAAQASIIDLDAGQVRHRVQVGGEPEGVTTAPDGLVWVTSEADGGVDVIDPIAPRVVTRITTGLRPRAVAFTRDGARGLVTNESGGSVTLVDVATRLPLDQIVLPSEGSTQVGPRPMGVAMSARGDHAYVTTGRGGSLAVIDLETMRVERMISDVGARPWGVGVTPDGLVVTANGPSDDITIVDPNSGGILARIRAGGSPWGIAIAP